jgi:hypothetical protein
MAHIFLITVEEVVIDVGDDGLDDESEKKGSAFAFPSISVVVVIYMISPPPFSLPNLVLA